MAEHQAIIKQVDHIAIRTTNPEYLFDILTNVLQLPIVWPMEYYGLALSGVVCAGNTNIEVFNFGTTCCSSDSEGIEANIYAIAFEPTSILENIRELSRRDIPHSPPIPYHGTRFDGYNGKLWTNIVLGGLLDGSSKSFSINRIIYRYKTLTEMIGNLIGRFICMPWASSVVQAASGNSALYLTEYAHDISRTRSIGANRLMSIEGGLIGLVSVSEIILGISDYDQKSARWQQLFNPVQQSEYGLWHLGVGPAIRLTSERQDFIQAIVLKVKSMENAKNQLAKFELLGITDTHQVSISIPGIQNLDIRLVE
jgi:hypothetical protein